MNTQPLISVKSNHKMRTFTIRKFQSNRPYAKYRTLKMDKEEFESCLYNTQNDWKYFLQSSMDYYEVK